MKTKKIPIRKCVGCKESAEKNELIRIVKDKTDNIFIDESLKANGRGVYIHKDSSCLEKAFTNKELERSLKCKINKEIYDELNKVIKE